ncbi:MAG: Arm DNA-binding domain-containing protein [Edaphobacter sp.]
MPLTDTAVKNAKPSVRTAKLFDERGLYLQVSPTGGKWWRLKYRFDGKEKKLGLGVYPDVRLKDARDRRDAARKLLANGIDPSQNRKVQKSAHADRTANSFEVSAREWFSKYIKTWSPSHSVRLVRLFERDIFPWIGGRPIADITAPEILTVFRRIEARGALRDGTSSIGQHWAGIPLRRCYGAGRA